MSYLQRRITMRRQCSCGLTLMELLVVMAIVGLLLALVIPSVSQWNRGGMNNALSSIGGLMSLAREEAISKNTYTWVAMGMGPEPNGVGEGIWCAVIESRDNTDRIGWSGGAIDLSLADQLRLLVSPKFLRDVELKEAGAINLDNLPEEPATSIVGLGAKSVTVTHGGRSIALSKIVQFTPSGEAKAEDTIKKYIEFGVLSARNPENAAVFRITGVTGRLNQYRE